MSCLALGADGIFFLPKKAYYLMQTSIHSTQTRKNTMKIASGTPSGNDSQPASRSSAWGGAFAYAGPRHGLSITDGLNMSGMATPKGLARLRAAAAYIAETNERCYRDAVLAGLI